MSLTPTNRSNECLICGETSGKCRQGREDLSYWQCMTYANTKKGEVVNGHKCIGHSKDGMWAQFKPDNSQEYTEQQRLEWKRKNQQHRQNKAKEDEQRRRRSLSAIERDKGYRQLLGELTLHPDDRADLVRRGFSHAQIELAGFVSVKAYQRLQGRYSDLLPGIVNGKVITTNDGYLCPVRNRDGLIAACQVRLRSLPDGDKNRYRWLSSNNQTLQLYPEGCKPEGELPLAVHLPEKLSKFAIGICEGTGAKPFLAAQKLGIPFIGAAGGQHTSSQVIFKSTLQQIEGTQSQNPIELIITPDAGDISNPLVMTRWQKTVELLEGWGYEVRFGWWGQVSKTHPDVDELEDFSTIQYINPREFFRLGQPSRVARHLDIPDDTPEWKKAAWKNWIQHRSFTNTIKSNSQYFNAPIPEANTIVFVKSGLGSGKTTWSKKVVEALKKQEVEGFFSLGYRNSLLIQLAEILGFHHIHDKENRCMWSEPGGGITLCVDSLLKFSPESFDNRVIIIDEICSVIKHLLHSSTVKNRDKILELFTEAIRRARQVICLDGMMADWVVNYLRDICPEKQVIKYENTYKGDKAPVNFLLGTIPEDEENGKIRVNDRSPIIKGILEHSEVPATCSDAQAWLEAMDNLLTEKDKKPLRIDSKTVPESHVKEFMRDSNKYLEANKGNPLLYSPSAESGLDVSVKEYFTEHFAVFYGVLDVDGMMQMLGRIRDTIPKFIWCKSFVSDDEKINTKSVFIANIEKALNDLVASDINSSLRGDEWLNKVMRKLDENISENLIHNRMSATLKAMENFEKSNLRECLRYALVEAGYDVVDCNPESNNYGEIAKEEVEEVKQQNSADIFNAKDIDIEKSEELAFDATWEKRCEVAKARLVKRLPGIKETPVWSADFIYLTKYKNRNFIDQQEMYWLLNNPNYAREEASKNLHWMVRKNAGFIGTYKSRWAKISAMLEVGLLKFAHSDNEWLDNSPELVELCKKARNFKEALGIQGKLSNIQFLGRLLGLMGLKLESRKTGKKTRCYHISQEVLNDPNRLRTLAAIELKFTQKESEPLASNDWKIALDEANGIIPENQPQTYTEQGVQTETPDPNLYRKHGQVSPENSEEKASEIGTHLEQLIEAMGWVDGVDALAAIGEGEEPDTIMAAINLSGSQPRRKMLREWAEKLWGRIWDGMPGTVLGQLAEAF